MDDVGRVMERLAERGIPAGPDAVYLRARAAATTLEQSRGTCRALVAALATSLLLAVLVPLASATLSEPPPSVAGGPDPLAAVNVWAANAPGSLLSRVPEPA